ncbi:MAG: hypothetical protein HYZ17_16750 [Betaproteobacteria bacterium]|nr:hypothetical protein [Betaproteobacteria bacterium]
MSKFFSQAPSTRTDSIAFSTLVVAGLLMLGAGTWSPRPEVAGAEIAATKAAVTKVASEANLQVPVQANARG